MFSPDSSHSAAAKGSATEFDQSATCASLVGSLRETVHSILDDQSADEVPDGVVQELVAMAVKLYVAKREVGAQLMPFAGHELTATEVVVATTSMLKAANLEVFELTMWNGFGTM